MLCKICLKPLPVGLGKLGPAAMGREGMRLMMSAEAANETAVGARPIDQLPEREFVTFECTTRVEQR